ncbi:MAG: hypothetical protein IJ168_00220 [Eubacterium sp.]|nr:hypothetical protein [Eubacterium sp.]
MGLFDKLKGNNNDKAAKVKKNEKTAAKNRKKGMIVCPYCFKQFSVNDVHFRADASDEVEEDQLLKAFYTDFKHSSYPCVVRKAYNPAVDPGNATYKIVSTTDGKKVKILDEFTPAGSNVPAKTRLCPHCHNKIPSSAGNGDAKVIAVIGSTQIGKTVFINSLIAEMLNINRKFNNFTFNFEEPSMIEDYRQQKKAIENGEIVATNRGYIRPIICKLYNNVTRATTVLSFYDFPGESTPDDIAKYSQDQFQHADGLILLFDLTATRSLYDACKKNNIRELQESINAVYSGMGFSPDQYDALSRLNVNLPDVENTRAMIQGVAEERESLARQVANATGIMQDRLKSQLAEKEAKERSLRERYTEELATMERFSEQVKSIIGKELSANEIAALKSVNDTKRQIDKKRASRIGNQPTSLDWLTTTYNSAFSDMDASAQDDRPVAFVGTKSDEIYRAVQNNCIDDSVLAENAHILSGGTTKTVNCLNLRDVDMIDAFVRQQLLSRNDSGYVSYVDGKFTDNKFFAVSALGTRYVDKIVMDESGNKKAIKELDGYSYITYQNDIVDAATGEQKTETVKVLDGEITPWRVDEPLLWVLSKFGIINAQYLNQ